MIEKTRHYRLRHAFVDRIRRFGHLLTSRRADYSALLSTTSVREVLDWRGGNRLLGFNGSALRLRIVHALSEAFGTTCFVETGTYHGATAITARRCLGLPVSSCEIVGLNHLVAKVVTVGMKDTDIVRSDTRTFMPTVVRRLTQLAQARPLFYLDAHGGTQGEACPIFDELLTILQLDRFVALLDDFAVPERDFSYDAYGSVTLSLDLLRGPLRAQGIKRVVFPDYPSRLETGYAQAGYAVIVRSPVVEQAIDRATLPLDLLRGVDVS